jgi:hypothetical protein
MMDELCNGEERRRKEAEEQDYERHLAQSLKHMKQQQLQGYRQALGGGGGGGAGLAQGAYDYNLDRYRNTPTGHLPVANGGTGETLDSPTLKRLKKLVGM